MYGVKRLNKNGKWVMLECVCESYEEALRWIHNAGWSEGNNAHVVKLEHVKLFHL
jgi:hypothetical protein